MSWKSKWITHIWAVLQKLISTVKGWPWWKIRRLWIFYIHQVLSTNIMVLNLGALWCNDCNDSFDFRRNHVISLLLKFCEKNMSNTQIHPNSQTGLGTSSVFAWNGTDTGWHMSARSLFVLLVLQHILLVPNQSAQMRQICITSNVPSFLCTILEKTIRTRPGGCLLNVATDGFFHISVLVSSSELFEFPILWSQTCANTPLPWGILRCSFAASLSPSLGT